MKNKIIIILISVVLVGLLLFLYFFNNKEESKVVEDLKTVSQINGYDYTLYEKDLDLYKEEFYLLKNNLESENIDFEEYAKSITKMFLIDLYDLDSKKNMYDVGGAEFVYDIAKENYVLNVTNTLYKYMIDNSDGKREQSLPKVKNVIVDSVTENKYKLNDKDYEGYKVVAKIEYVNDLGYDDAAEVLLIKDDKTLYIVEKN